MTKTLTEQWKNGKLPREFYYIRDRRKEVYLSCLIDYKTEKDWVKEVLAPVPSYDEYNELKQDNKYLKSGIETRDKQIEQLEKRLAIATNALKEYETAAGWGRQAFLALKEMEGVK